jgi:HEAT repeat protein
VCNALHTSTVFSLEVVMIRIVVVLVSVFCAACADHAKHSIALYEAGDYAGAARAADDELAQHPGDGAVWGMRIRAALALGDAPGLATTYESYAKHGTDKDLLRDLAIATLDQALASPSARLKITAIKTVEDLELYALADQVAMRMGDADERVQAAAAVAVLHGYPQAPQVASDMLHGENPEARRIALEGVAKKIGKLAIADIEQAADDGDPRVRAVALRFLGTLKDKDAVEVCTKRLRDPDESVRAAAAGAIARIGIGNLEASGKVALKDTALAVRLAGIDLLVAAHRQDELVPFADDADPSLAVQAAIAVKAQHPELAQKAVQRAVASDDLHVRAGVANALVQALGKDAAVPIAQKLAADKEPSVRLAAARVLAHAGDAETAKRVFAEAVATHDDQAAADLAALGDARGTAELSSLVRDPQRSPEQRAATAAAHRSGHRVTPGLVAALADPSGLVRVEAASALAALAH